MRLVLSAMALALVGCGRGPSVPSVQPVTGKVTLASGKPLVGAVVRFVPVDLTAVEGEAELEPDGTFTLKSIGDKPGGVTGTYKVVIDPTTNARMRPPALATFARNSVPRAHRAPETTPLSAKIEEGPNHFDLIVR